MSKKIILVFVFALLIRLIALDQSLWLDEAVTAHVVKTYNFVQIVSQFSPKDFHPPLYYLFMKLWSNLFGYSEIALRMPSVLFSLATGYLIYLMAGIWGATFFLFNPLIIYYSQEARMYMGATFFLTAALYYLKKMLQIQKSIRQLADKSQKIEVLFFVIFISLAFLTFYGSIFLIAAMFCYLIFKKKYRFFIYSFIIFLFSLILISPLLYQQLLYSKAGLSNVKNWSLVLGKANIKDLLLIPVKFSIGRISFYPKWIYWAVTGIWTGLVWLLVLIQKPKVKSFLFLLIFPLILGFGISFFVPMLQYFRFIYLIPIMAILLAANNSSMLRYITIIGFIIFSLVYLLIPHFHREDWKGLVANLPKNLPVYMITSSSDPVKYYNENLTVKELRGLRVNGFDKEVIVIPYTFEVYGLNYKSLLKESGYQLKKEVSFREVTYELWSK